MACKDRTVSSVLLIGKFGCDLLSSQLSLWCKRAGIMTNIKAGVPRGAYKGVVTIWKDGVKVYITPSSFNAS